MGARPNQQNYEVAGGISVGMFDYTLELESVGDLAYNNFSIVESATLDITFKLTNISGTSGFISSLNVLQSGEGYQVSNPFGSSYWVLPIASDHSNTSTSFLDIDGNAITNLYIDSLEDHPDPYYFKLRIVASANESVDSFFTKIILNDGLTSAHGCEFKLSFQKLVNATVLPYYNVGSHGTTTRYDFTYVGEEASGRSPFDLSLAMVNNANTDGNVGNYTQYTTIVFQDRDGNTITSIPNYGTTDFKVLVTSINNVDEWLYRLRYWIRFYNNIESVDRKSEEFELELIQSLYGYSAFIGAEDGDTKTFTYDLIANGDEVTASVPVRMYFGDATYYLEIENISSYPNIIIENIPSVSVSTSSPSSTINFNIQAGAGQQSLEEVVFNLLLKDVNGNVIDNEGRLILNVTGAVINFSLTNNRFVIPQNGSITLDANVSIEDNGVTLTDPLSLVASNLPDSISVHSPSIAPTRSSDLFPITLSINDGNESLKNHPVTLTLQVGEINASVSFYITVFFSSVSDFKPNPIIENDGIVRVLAGNNAVVKGAIAQGTWLGYIDRTYMNGLLKPEPNFQIHPTTIIPFGKSEEEVSIVTTTTGAEGFTDETHYYKIAQIYDGNQRSLLSSVYEADYNGNATSDPIVYKVGEFTIKIPVDKFNERVTELEIYRSATLNGGYSRILNIPLVDDTSPYTTGLNSTTTSTTFTGNVRTGKTMYSDLGANYSADSYDPNTGDIDDVFWMSSHWQIVRDEALLGGFKDKKNWDYYMNLKTDSDGILSIEYKTTDSGGLRTGRHTEARGVGDSLFKASVKIKNYMRFKTNTFGAYKEGTSSRSVDPIPCTIYRGRDLIYCTADTGTENSLVGKYLKYTGGGAVQIRQITANNGKFIQVDSKWDGVNDITGATFTILESSTNVVFSKTTGAIKKYQITFNDMKLASIGTTAIESEISIDVNGRYATAINGRLFQGNIILDPSGVAEVRPFWVSYSELDQFDVNPVSNILTFLDREGGSVTGLSSLYGRLVVMKEHSIYMVNCPSNVDPSLWSADESIHNIGSIAPEGYIEQGDKLYIVYHDGVYRLVANNLADTDATPTEKLKITDPIQDVFDSIHSKEKIISIYDQTNDEILFRWHRNPKNLVLNSDFSSGASHWNLDANAGGSIANQITVSSSGVQTTNDNFCVKIEAKGSVKSLGNAIFSNFVPLEEGSPYTVSFDAQVLNLSNEAFKVNVLFYDQNKSQIGGYPSIKSFDSTMETWTRYFKTFTTDGANNTGVIPSGAKYMRFRAYWWTSSNTSFPQGEGYIDQVQIEKSSSATDFETYESKQEIWGYNVVTGQWREIYTSGSVGRFAYDNDNSVIYWDNKDHLIKSFSTKESISASLKTHPVSLTSERSEIVRQINTKIKSDDALTVNVIPNEDTTKQVSKTLSTQTTPTLEKRRLKSRCKKVQIEIIAPQSKNDVEIHNIDLEYS